MIFMHYSINITMQTIYTFSYNPAIATGTKTIGTQWRMAYQAPINLYKGIPNTIRIVVFTSNQKVVDLSELDIEIKVIDITSKQTLITKLAETSNPENGIASIYFTPSELNSLDHRFYHIIVRLLPLGDGSSLTDSEILYFDDNYGVFTPVIVEDAWNF